MRRRNTSVGTRRHCRRHPCRGTTRASGNAILVHRSGPASDNIAPGVELNVAFTGDFPDVVAASRSRSRRASSTSSERVPDALGRRSARDGDNASAASPSGSRSRPRTRSRQRRMLRAVAASRANTRVIWDGRPARDRSASSATERRRRADAERRADADLAGTASLSTGNAWTPSSAARSSSPSPPSARSAPSR